MIDVRAEAAADVAAIRRVNLEAFGQPDEADLVDRLRANGGVTSSFVALMDGRVVGHILFSKVEIEGGAEISTVGLAPMAVLPGHQRSGIGSKLVVHGLEELSRGGYEAVVVLGHAQYYPRFGFTPASRFGLSSKWEVPDEVFMALELRPGALASAAGRVHYRDEFDAF